MSPTTATPPSRRDLREPASGSGGPGRRLRVLALAEAANPELTSVALIGWSASWLVSG